MFIDFDNLIYGTVPSIQVGSRTVTGAVERGTLLGKTSSGEMVVYGTAETTSTPDCIVADSIEKAGVATVYTAGCFNANKVILAEDYTLTDADKDALRKIDIIIKSAQE